jgi:hypothetical protein
VPKNIKAKPITSRSDFVGLLMERRVLVKIVTKTSPKPEKASIVMSLRMSFELISQSLCELKEQ